MSRPPLRFLLVVPAYRESARLPRFLGALAERLEAEFPEGRVLVCDDGSGEEETRKLRAELAPLLERHASLLPPLYLPQNRGKGGAILAGWESCLEEGYEFFGFVDADGAISAGEVCRVLERVAEGNRRMAFFGSRVKMLGRVIERSTQRHIMGRVFATLVDALIDSEVYDSQCGLKLIPAEAVRTVRPWLKGRGFAFDVELIAFLRATGCGMKEVPIDWRDIPGSKVHLLRDSWRMLREIAAIRRELERFRR